MVFLNAIKYEISSFRVILTSPDLESASAWQSSAEGWVGLCLGPKVSALCQSCPHKRTRATFSLLTHQGVTLMNFLHFIPHNEGNSAVELN